MTDKTKVGAAQVRAALRERHPPHYGWLCFEEVCEPDSQRRADFLALATFRNRGLELHGFEVKVSRQDWLNELKDPTKAEAFAKHCERWWLAAPDGVVRDIDEIPPGWGFMQYYPEKDDQPAKLIIRRRAPRQGNTSIDRRLVIGLLRAVERYFSQPITKAIEEAKEEGRQYGYNQGLRAARDQEETYSERKLKEKVERFEEACGLSITDEFFQWKELGKAVKLLMEAKRRNKHDWLIKDLRERGQAALQCAEMLERVEGEGK